MAITRAQQYRQMLENGGRGISLQEAKDMAPKGEFLAYINKKEAKMLKDAGGSGIMTNAGIPSFIEYGSDDPDTFSQAASTGSVQGDVDRGGGGGDDNNQPPTKAPPPKPKAPPVKTRDRFIPPTLKAINYVGGMIKDSRLGRFLNTKSRENYLNNLKETNPELYQDTVDDLEKLGYATRDVEIYGPKGKRDGLMAPGRDIETFQDLYEDQAKSILNTVTDNEDGGVGTLYDDYLNRNKTEDMDRGDDFEQDPCKGPNPPAYCFVNQDDDDTNTGGLAIRFRKDGGRINAMDGGMMSPEGGIMDLETGRQMYFLGKLVKKATRAVKKIVKSPIGKAALLYAGTGGLGNLASGKAFFSNFMSPTNFLAKKNLTNIFTKKGIGNILLGGQRFTGNPIKGAAVDFGGLFGKGGEFGFGRTALTLSAILPFLSEEEQQQLISSRGVSIDPGYIRDNPYTFASQVGSGSGMARAFSANGGRIGYQEGSKEPVAKKTMPLLDMGGKEMDLRDDGGFVPLGRMERADDVPARLSKNEFVFTADAVRNAGEGDVDKGAEVMYNMMKNLESGGEVSEESQGLSGAREMFQTSKRLEEVL
jgi:hypothetical protein